MFARTDADDLFHVGDPDLSVPDFARGCCLANHIDSALEGAVLDYQFDSHFWYEINLVLRTAVGLGMATLAAKALTSDTVMPWTPAALRASLTSSSLNGFTIAVINFMVLVCLLIGSESDHYW